MSKAKPTEHDVTHACNV